MDLRNLGSTLRERSRSNRLIRRALDDGASLTGEVNDLFYFFDGFGQYLLSYARVPRLRPDHDERVGELLDAMGGLDLRTQEERTWCWEVRNECDNEPLPSPVHAYAKELARTENMILGGQAKPDNTPDLMKSGLTEYLSQKTNKHAVRAAVGAAVGGGGCFMATYSPEAPGTSVICGIAGALFFASGGFVRPQAYVLPAYRSLVKKAGRMDEGILQEMRR